MRKKIVCVSIDLLFNKSSVRPYKYEKRDLEQRRIQSFYANKEKECYVHKLFVKTTLEERPMRFDNRKKK